MGHIPQNGTIPSDQTVKKPVPTPEQSARYIADITLELRDMARRAGMNFLAYLLEMAFQEAFSRYNRQDKAAQRSNK